MKLLLHTCCAPCLLYPEKILRAQGFDITSYFYNPNIHPYREFRKRLQSLEDYTRNKRTSIIVERDYGLRSFLRKVVFNEERRCILCYEMRLEQTVLFAKENNFPFFSTTLLYSRYQNHSLIKKNCLLLAEKHGLSFIYHDFRIGWQEGIDFSNELGLYRQPYCGCIYSEQERYDNRLKKARRKQKQSGINNHG